MKFHELGVNEKFLFNDKEFIKVPEERISCCKIGCNAHELSTGKKVVFKPLDEVTKTNN